MKNMTQSSSVASARPWVNSWGTVKPSCPSSAMLNGPRKTDGAAPSFETMEVMAGAAGLLRRRKRTDSGSATTSNGTSSKGTTPPNTNTDGQPNRGTRSPATSPPNAAPRENPQNIAMTMMAWRRFGLYSDINAMAFGMAAPSPTPV